MIFDFILLPFFTILIYLMGLGLAGCVRFLPGGTTSEFPAYSLPLLGLFAIGFVSLLVNFFVGVDSIFTYALLAMLLLLGLFRLNANAIPAAGPIVLIAFAMTPFFANMEPGFDGGLYHLPHQKWIRDEPIVIGL